MYIKNFREHLDKFMSNRGYPIDSGIIKLPGSQYQRLSDFGALTLGIGKQISVFTAMKILAKEYESIKQLLCSSSTAIGQVIDDVVIKNLDDVWFNSIILYRPDMLVAKNGKVYTNELEIVCGGYSRVSLLQECMFGHKLLLGQFLDAMRSYRDNLKLSGCIAILGDRDNSNQIDDNQWLMQYYDDLVVTYIDQLDFKPDGVYFNKVKIAVAQIFASAYKLEQQNNQYTVNLFNLWLDRKVFIFSTPSLLMDNKIILNILQEPLYQDRLIQLLGKGRYETINSYLPKTYIYDQDDTENSQVLDILQEPWKYGKFIIKYATLWSCHNMLVSPDSNGDSAGWNLKINNMLKDTEKFGKLIIQELIDVSELPVDQTHMIYGKTKFTPFFIHDGFRGEVKLVDINVNITPNSYVAHFDQHSKFGLVRAE